MAFKKVKVYSKCEIAADGKHNWSTMEGIDAEGNHYKVVQCKECGGLPK